MSVLSNPNNTKRIEEAIANGFDVDVYAFDRKNDTPSLPKGVDVKILGSFTSDIPYWKRIGLLKRGIKSVLAHYKDDECVYYLFRNDIAILFSLLSRRPYIFEEADMTHANIGIHVVRISTEWMVKRIIRKSVLSVFRSEGFLQYHFGNNCPDNVYVIPNRLHPDVLTLPKMDAQAVDENCIKFAFVGSIRYNTIYTFSQTLLKHFPQHEFHFYGGFATKYIEEQYKSFAKYPKCYFHGGFKSPNDLPGIYSKIDVLLSAYDVTTINPRYAEPNKLYEAIYFDKPIIVSSNSFLADKVKRLGIGYEVNALDEKSIINLIKSISAKNLEEKRLHISSIDKKNCINNNDDFFGKLKRLLG